MIINQTIEQTLTPQSENMDVDQLSDKNQLDTDDSSKIQKPKAKRSRKSLSSIEPNTNSCSSTISTSSENSNKNTYSFKSNSSEDEQLKLTFLNSLPFADYENQETSNEKKPARNTREKKSLGSKETIKTESISTNNEKADDKNETKKAKNKKSTELANKTLPARINQKRKSTSSSASTVSDASSKKRSKSNVNINTSKTTNKTSNVEKNAKNAKNETKNGKQNKSTNGNSAKKTENKDKKVKESKKKRLKKEVEKKEDDEDDDNDDEEEEEEEEEKEDDEESDEEENARASILEDLDLEYLKLQYGGQALKKENICSKCELPCEVIDCQGSCQQSFHLGCVGLQIEPEGGFKCDECKSGLHSCFVCKKPAEASMPTKKCASSSCGKYFHEECAKTNELFRKEGAHSKASFLCPLHTCATCWYETRYKSGSSSSSNCSSLVNPKTSQQPFKGKFMKCIRCPTAYHVGDFCIAAGSKVIAGNNMICSNHFKPIKSLAQHNLLNVSWCFVCCKNGDLVGCNKCPAAYHYNCLENPPPLNTLTNPVKKEQDEKKEQEEKKQEAETPSESKQPSMPHSPSSVHSSVTTSTMTSSDSMKHALSIISSNWTCEDCTHGRRPLLGQIVWAKVGTYRWWPAQIIKQCNLPNNLKERSYQIGEFPVRFFGTDDYFWLNIGRIFTFAEDDECHGAISNKKSLAVSFKRGVEIAQVAFKEIQRLKNERLAKISGKSALKSAKDNFQYIKTNKAVGNVPVYRLPVKELPRCDCDPKSANPCGSDSCMNRMLKYECHPAICPAGERCQNQRFVKRIYPKQEPIHTGARGWGLRNLVDVKKGDLVNEYVGELIDNEECKRRLELAHENDICNFYFLTMDKDRIIDAGPKGNLARFMNHSCDPNCVTEKWLVNGDIRVGLFAKADIPANTELTFNYNLDCLSNEKAICRCGAGNCSGFIGDRPKNNEAKNTKALNNNNNNNNTATSSTNVNSKKRKLSESPVKIKKGRASLGHVKKENSNAKLSKSKPRSKSVTIKKPTKKDTSNRSFKKIK